MDRWTPFIKTAESDDWTRMSDAQARKRAQNRLAQRAHRKRHRQQMKPNGAAETGQSNGTVGAPKDVVQAVTTIPQPTERTSLSLGSKQSVTPMELLAAQHPPRPVTTYNQQYPLISLSGLDTLTAMLTNAHILQINCKTTPRAKMIHISSSIPTPPALTPTSLQSSQPHLPYVDLLPFSSLRDNLIKAEDMIIAPELWSDLVGGGIQVWGQTPWDIRGWEVQEYFATKWWWLMTAEVLTEANFWRVSRGEDPLILEDIKSNLARPVLSVN